MKTKKNKTDKSYKYAFPDDETRKRIRDELSDPDYDGGSYGLPESPSEIDKAKYQICQLIAKYKRVHKLMQKDVAEKIGVDEARISELLRCKIESFTLDRLIGYAQKIHPALRIQIIAA